MSFSWRSASLAVAILVVVSAPHAYASGSRVIVTATGLDAKSGNTEEANGILQAEVESYLKRELRAIGDVELVPDFAHADYWLALSVFRTNDGYCLSALYYAVTHTITGPRWWDHGQIPEDCQNQVDRVLASFEGTLTYLNGLNGTRGYDGLKGGCEGIVANFDTTILDPRRTGG